MRHHAASFARCDERGEKAGRGVFSTGSTDCRMVMSDDEGAKIRGLSALASTMFFLPITFRAACKWCQEARGGGFAARVFVGSYKSMRSLCKMQKWKRATTKFGIKINYNS